MDNRVLESMVITPVVEEEVQAIINSLKDSSAGTGSKNNLLKCYYPH